MARRPAPARLDPTVRDALRKGIEEFNSWRFYDCHETLEDVWRESGGKAVDAPLAGFYQGLIKVAAGFHHLIRDNHKGAVNLLSDALRLLEPYRPAALGVDVEGLVAGVRRALDAVVGLGPGRLRDFDRSLIPTIKYDRDALDAA